MAAEGPIDGESFRTYVERSSCRRCVKAISSLWTISAVTRARRCGDSPGGRRQALLPAHLPPRLNPIEQVFAKLKHLMRKAAARTVETVCAAIGELLGAFTAIECANYFETQDMPKPNIIMLWLPPPDAARPRRRGDRIISLQQRE